MPPPIVAIASDPRLRVLPFISCLTVLLALVISCAASSPAATSVSGPAAGAQTPVDILKRSTEAMDTVKNFSTRMDIDMEVLGQDMSLTMDMDVGQGGRMRTNMRVDTPVGRQTIEQIIASPDVYIKMEGVGVGWMRMDLNDVAEASGVTTEMLADPKAFSSTLFPAEDIPWELYTVSSAGREKIDGVQTEHLKVQVDFQELWGNMDTGEKDRFTSSFAAPGLDMGGIFEETQVEKMELWIDDKGFQRRLVMEMVLGDFGTVKMDMRMFDFNKDIRIELPKDFTDVP